jgi:DNA-binding IclR family transcriptional regulator
VIDADPASPTYGQLLASAATDQTSNNPHHTEYWMPASGKLFVSLLPARTRKRLLATLPLERRTARTLVEPALLEAEFARIREVRFGTDNEEFLEGLVAASVPVLDAGGRPIAAVAVHGPVGRLSLERVVSLVPRLRQAADELAGAFEVA